MGSYRIRSKIWIEVDDEVLMGQGRFDLLKAIEANGSLSKAAKCLGISYKKAWRLVDSINKNANKPLVIKSVGGKNGGETKLTLYGKKLIGVFDTINKKCWSFLDNELSILEKL